jgi:hypothetical protein
VEAGKFKVQSSKFFWQITNADGSKDTVRFERNIDLTASTELSLPCNQELPSINNSLSFLNKHKI